MKVPLHSHGPYRQAAAGRRGVPITGRVQQAIQMIQQAVYPIRRAGCRWTLISYAKIRATAAQLENHLGYRAAQLLAGPLSQAPQALREGRLGFALIGLPHPPQHVVAQLATTARRDLEHRMQVAQDQLDLWKQQAPRFAGGRPAVGADRDVNGRPKFPTFGRLKIPTPVVLLQDAQAISFYLNPRIKSEECKKDK